MRNGIVALLGSIAVSGMLLAPPARAEPSAQVPASESQGPRRFYGWQVLGGSALSAGLFFGGRSLESKGPKGILITFAFLTGFFSAPLVHHLNGQPDSVAQRSGQIVGTAGAVGGLGALVLSAQDKGASSTDRGNAALLGIEVGFLLGSVADALVFGWKSDVHLQPELTPTHVGMSIGASF